MILKSPEGRLIAHTLIAFSAAFFPLWITAGEPLAKDAIVGVVVAAIRALIGVTTSTNPSVGKNVV